MCRVAALALALMFVAIPARSDDTAPPENVIGAVKRATVFIQAEAGAKKWSGSGFVTTVMKDTVLIATNYHVVAGPAFDPKRHPTPAELIRHLKAASLTVVFDSGTKTERSIKAEAIAADAENDLAILRLTGVKDPPTAIDYASPPKLVETMPVYTFGFPFGKSLAIGKGSPAITVGKASISSIRLDDNGELSVVQIDGALNPGNSGGPIVDVKGRLVGVAVATIRDSSGIGLAIPAAELGRVMKGRLGGVHVTTTNAADGKVTLKAEVGVIDPHEAIRGITLHFLTVAPKDAKPGSAEKLEKQPGVLRLALKLDGGVALGETTLDAAAGELFFQAFAAHGSDAVVSTMLRSLVLRGVNRAPELGDKPPPGWKEFTPRDNAFTVWVPEKTVRQAENERTVLIRTERLRITVLHIEMPLRLTYQVERLTLPLSLARNTKRKDLENLFRDALVSELGKITEESETKLGPLTGSDYLIEGKNGFAHVRIFVSGSRVFLLRAEAPSQEQVQNEAALRFLNSCRLPTAPISPTVTNPPPVGPTVTNPPPKAVTNSATPNAKVTKIQGGGNDPEFNDVGPEGALLVGFEIGLAKFFNNDVVKAIRPVYRLGDNDSLGAQQGTEIGNVVKAIAKPGYAVGAITLKTGLGVDGISVTFMKIDGARLDPKDAYESDWIGGMGGAGAVKLSGEGAQVVGLTGRCNRRDVNGLGLIFDRAVTRGKKTAVAGFALDPDFIDPGPDGALLVGFEVGLTKSGKNQVPRSVRPVYQVGDKESPGEQRGLAPLNVKAIAKPGYAVGALNVVSGLGIDGFSVTFMKITGDKLDPKDNYESEWIGCNGDRPRTKLGGDGTPSIGLLGKTNKRNEFTGIGLFLKSAEGAGSANK